MRSQAVYTVRKLSRLTGITVRTLHHYDAIGLLKPTAVGENGYRYYGEDALQRLQQILFFREMDLSLAAIQDILDGPGFDQAEALRAHREALQARIHRLNTLVHTIDATLRHLEEGITMSSQDMFAGFSEEQQEAYAKEAEQLYDPELVRESNRRWKGYSKAEQQAAMQEMGQVYTDLAALSSRDPADPAVQAVMARWHQSIRRFYEPTPEILRGLGDLYLQDARFTDTFDRVQPGLAVVMQRAIAVYVDGLEQRGP
jgi:MerR family transcriptional regulator, thiopeptide resistance regulator